MENNKFLLITLIGLIVLFSGCIYQSGNPYLDLELLTEDQLVSFNEEFVNLTLTDFSPYPTLKDAILKIIDPTANVTDVKVEITYDEMNRIQTDILNEIYEYIAYEESLFRIYFAIPRTVR